MAAQAYRERGRVTTRRMRATGAAARYVGRTWMCGRTALTAEAEDLRRAIGLDALPALVPRYNVPPSQPVALLRETAGTQKRRIDLVRWGLVPAWAKTAKGSHKLALARAETIVNAPAYRDAVRKRRGLVIVDGFFEWRRDGTRPSQPFFVRRADHRAFALAGVWERWIGNDGEVVESCAIITQPARPPVDAIHDRMPLVLERDAWDRWLDPRSMDVAALAQLLHPHAPALIAYPVSQSMNDPRHDDRHCIEPVEPPQLGLF